MLVWLFFRRAKHPEYESIYITRIYFSSLCIIYVKYAPKDTRKPLSKLAKFGRYLKKRLLRPGTMGGSSLVERAARGHRLRGERARPSIREHNAPNGRYAVVLYLLFEVFTEASLRFVTWRAGGGGARLRDVT